MPSLIGNKPNQVPSNGDLGTLAFQDASNVLVGNVNATGVTTVQAGTVSAPAITTTGDTNTGIFFPAADTIAFSEGGVESMRIDSSGGVGIGIAGAQTRFQVVASGASSFEVARLGNSQSNSSGVGVKLGFQPNNDFVSNGLIGASVSAVGDGAPNNISLVFGTGTGGSESERMRIDSSGNLGLGVSGTVGGNTWKFGSVFTSLGLGLACTNGSGNMANFYTSTSTFAGSITASGSTTTYATSSDYRLKENIAPMTGALATVAQLKPCTYTWKVDGSSGQGFIAHELQAVVPDCVTGEKDAVDEDGKPVYQGIDTSFLVATLTAAIQEQQTLIENLTTRLTALEGN
jgi:hypothetical protein